MAHPRRTFLATAGLGLLASGVATVSAAELTDEEKKNVQLVADFCASWSTRDLERVFPHLADDCLYRMTETIPAVTGHAGVTEKLGSWMTSSDLGIEFKILETFAAGPMVINRRIDSFKSTKQPLTWEGIGVFFCKDGKIKEWSDYTTKVVRGPQ
jgi:limonene-1,2-epoxide hydrolase